MILLCNRSLLLHFALIASYKKVDHNFYEFRPVFSVFRGNAEKWKARSTPSSGSSHGRRWRKLCGAFACSSVVLFALTDLLPTVRTACCAQIANPVTTRRTTASSGWRRILRCRAS